MEKSYLQRYAAALLEWRRGKGMTGYQIVAWLREREGGRAPTVAALYRWERGYLPSKKWWPMLARAGFVPPARNAPSPCGLARYA